MTTPAPVASEPIRDSRPPAAPAPVDRSEIRRLWAITVTVSVVVLLATIGVLAWQWLGPGSGTVAN
jgi:hypothetical protein